MRSPHVTMIAVVALAVSAVGGFAVAAGTSTRTVHACANSKGDLKLLSAKGRCAKGYSKVTLDKTGPKGATGVRGKPGAPGTPGMAGPGAQSSVATGTSPNEDVDGSSLSVAGTDLTILTQCSAGDHTRVTINGSSNYVVRGAVQAAITGDATSDVFYQVDANDGATTDIHNGGSLIDYANNAGAALRSSEIEADFESTGGAELGTTVLVTDGAVTFSMTVFLAVDMTSCQVSVQVTPTA
jgi:hypothetical protein